MATPISQPSSANVDADHTSPTQLDPTDHRIISALRVRRRATVSDLSRYLGLARGTVHARLERMERDEVILGYGPDLTLRTAGYPVRAFTTLTITQGRHDEVVAALRAVPNILEVHTITGPGDMLVKIGARSNDHLHELLQEISGINAVVQLTTQLALASPVLRSAADLLVATDRSA